MNRTKLIIMTLLCLSGCTLALLKNTLVLASTTAQAVSTEKAPADVARDSAAGNQQPVSASHAAREEKAFQDARRQQLAEKEAALLAKEQELKKLSSKLEAQVKALEDSKKRLDDRLKVQTEDQKKKLDEKIQKMVKLFKTMRSEQAAKLIDTLHEDLAMSLLTRLDTKTVAKLAPFISQPRVVKWVTENLQGK